MEREAFAQELAELASNEFLDPMLLQNVNWDSLMQIVDGEKRKIDVSELSPGMEIEVKCDVSDMLSATPESSGTLSLTIDQVKIENGEVAIASGENMYSTQNFTENYLSHIADQYTQRMNSGQTKQQTQNTEYQNSWVSQSQHSPTIHEFNDYQKVQCTQVSYINVNQEGIDAIKNGGVRLSEIDQYVEDKDQWMFGDVLNSHKVSKLAARSVVGDDDRMYVTDGDLAQRMKDAGLGDLVVKDIVSDPKTGFQAMALEDSEGNVIISYRGSDIDWANGAKGDWIDSDFKEFFSPELSSQIDQAQEFFDRNKSTNGETAVYGHSLGGNLTSHIFAENHSEISEAFAFNANPIDQKQLDTPEKKAAFQSEKFTFATVGGDFVSRIKDTCEYENRIVHIQNNHYGKDNFIAAHLADSISVDKDGNFVRDPDPDSEYNWLEKAAEKGLHKTKEWLNNHEQTTTAIVQVFQGKIPDNMKEVWAEWMQDVKDRRNKEKGERVGSARFPDSGEEIAKTTDSIVKDVKEASIIGQSQNTVGSIFENQEVQNILDSNFAHAAMGEIAAGQKEPDIDLTKVFPEYEGYDGVSIQGLDLETLSISGMSMDLSKIFGLEEQVLQNVQGLPHALQLDTVGPIMDTVSGMTGMTIEDQDIGALVQTTIGDIIEGRNGAGIPFVEEMGDLEIDGLGIDPMDIDEEIEAGFEISFGK